MKGKNLKEIIRIKKESNIARYKYKVNKNSLINGYFNLELIPNLYVTNIEKELKKLRLKNKLTQQECSDKTKIKRYYISRYENRKRGIPFKHLRELLGSYGTVIYKFLSNTKPLFKINWGKEEKIPLIPNKEIEYLLSQISRFNKHQIRFLKINDKIKDILKRYFNIEEIKGATIKFNDARYYYVISTLLCRFIKTFYEPIKPTFDLNYKNDLLLTEELKVGDTLIKENKFDSFFLKYDYENPLNSIINIYGALIKKSDFKVYDGKKFSKILKGVYIYSENFKSLIPEIYELLSKKFKNPTKVILNALEYYRNKEQNKPLNYLIEGYLSKDKISLILIRVIARILQNEFDINEKELLIEIISKADYIGTNLGYFRHRLKLKDFIEDDIIYQVGCLAGDQHLSKDAYVLNLIDGGKNDEELPLVFENLNKHLKLFNKLWKFSREIKISKPQERCFVLKLRNKPFVRLINFVYGLPIGYKYNDLHEPHIFKLINDSELRNKKQALFYKGLFDSDGGCNKRNLSYSSKSKEFMEECKRFLDKNGIFCRFFAKTHKDGRLTYNVSTYAESFLKFMELIGSDHPKRSKMMWKDYYEQRGVSI